MMVKIMEIIYFILCFIQPIILPTPEVASVMGASIALGSLKAFTIGLTGTVFGIIFMYFISKKLGEKFINRLVNEKQLERYKKYIQRNELLLTWVMFIFPVLPDEIVCVGAGIVGINFKTFIIIAILSKTITVFSYAYSIQIAEVLNISRGEFVLIGCIILIFALLISRLIKTKGVKTRAN